MFLFVFFLPPSLYLHHCRGLRLRRRCHRHRLCCLGKGRSMESITSEGELFLHRRIKQPTQFLNETNPCIFISCVLHMCVFMLVFIIIYKLVSQA